MTLADDAINIHRILRGKIEICNKISLDHSETGNIERSKKTTLDMVYTPGVAFVAEQISKDKSLAYDFTSKWNNIAIVCDGTRVLGLGNIGPEGALAVMEGKSILYKILGNINAYPLCIDLKDKDDIIKFVKAIHPMFSAINIEDIESPKVLDIVDELQNELPLPIFHDDQHGTAIITLAALLNALKLVKKEISNAKVVIAGAGSAGYGIFKILKQTGAKDIVVADSLGAIFKERDQGIDNKYKREIADNTNLQNLHGDLKALLENADVFIGVSGKENLLNKATIKSMNRDPIIFALSNPDPEILPSD
ncbi:MAG TPA: malic enzyme-like NAD(P)-binding protein, partial [Candidatus Nitrosocosmicus sp.]|nr:malic enzyme-like NAD(P)-binding protein [Candidatus Nitrosocosmicus sp.]